MTTIADDKTPTWTLPILLLAGGLCVAFGQGRWPVPLAAFLAPVLLLRYTRRAPLWPAIVGFIVVHAVAWEIAYSGMIKMPAAARWALLGGLSVVLAGVYLADRRLSRLACGFWTTLVFPTGWVAFEYLNGRFSPSGSWASIAYTFTEQPALLQVASLVGWTGVTFLVGWVAAVVNWTWQRTPPPACRRGVGLCAATVAATLVFGSVRLWTPSAAETLRIASIVGPSPFLDEGRFREDVWAYTRGVEIPDEQTAAAQSQIRRTLERHLALAEHELRGGARLVSFPEANPAITELEEADFVAAAGRLAAQFEAHVGLGLFVFRPQAGLPAENKYILLGPDGSVVWDYLKSKRVPGSSHVIGGGVLPDADTSLGRLSTAICFDMDFPHLLRQAGTYGTELLLAPSNDWTAVRATHARMAVVRAVEQGFTMVRPTKDGFSLVSDPLGRTIAWQDTDAPGEHVLVASVPVRGIRTVYGAIGDVFSWVCIAVFLVSVVIARRKSEESAVKSEEK